MADEFFDVVILGGGPAGAAVALSLRRHNPALRVIIIERSDYAALRVGETLTPNVRPLLEQLNVWPSFERRHYMPAHGTASAWGSAELRANPFVFRTEGCGWHLDRRDFDRWLADEAIQRGAVLYVSSVVVAHQRQQDGPWRLTVQTRNGDCNAHFDLNARFVVDATGRSAHFSKRQGTKHITYDRLMSIAALFPVNECDTYTLVEASEFGWWYSAALPQHKLIVAFMTDADQVQRQRLSHPQAWNAQLALTSHTKARLAQVSQTAAKIASASFADQTLLKVWAAYSRQLEHVIGHAWLAVGDAATTFDPLSSQGVFKAIRSGLFASYAILDYLKGNSSGLDKYSRMISAEYAYYLQTWHGYYSLEERWQSSAFWQRRQRPRMAQFI